MASRDLADFRTVDPGQQQFDARGFYESLQAFCRPLRLESSQPFLVSWYNESRKANAGGKQCIDAPDNAVAFAIYATPGYLETVAGYYRRQRPKSGFVDATTNDILEQLRTTLRPELDPFILNTDVPPYYHVQTMGSVAGVDQHVEPEELTGPEMDEWREELGDRLEESRDPKMWGTETSMLRKIFGVNVHPVYGGWYAYRALVVLRRGLAEGLKRPSPQQFLQPAQARRIISEYNLRHAECIWRDLDEQTHPPDRRYNTDEFLFFTEVQPGKRRRWLEMRVAQLEQDERRQAQLLTTSREARPAEQQKNRAGSRIPRLCAVLGLCGGGGAASI